MGCLGSGQTMLQRERSHGLRVPAYALARMTVDSLDVLLGAMVYVTIYYLAAAPKLPSQYYLATLLLVSTVISGWGYLVSVLSPPSNSTLTVAAVMLVLNGVLGNPSYVETWIDGSFTEVLVALSPARWGMQMLFVEQFVVFLKMPRGSDAALVVAYKSQALDQGQEIKDSDSTFYTDLERANEANETSQYFKQDYSKHWSTAVWVLLVQAVLLRLLAVGVLCYKEQMGSAASNAISRLTEPRPKPGTTVQRCSAESAGKVTTPEEGTRTPKKESSEVSVSADASVFETSSFEDTG